MILREGGIVWQVLRWYGYPLWRLREGISLCKTFWSILAGVLILAPVRAFIQTFSVPGGWAERKWGLDTAAGITAGIGALWVAFVFGFLAYLLPGGAGWELAIYILVGLAFAGITGFGLVAVGAVSRSKTTERARGDISEVAGVVGGFLSVIKRKACPTIRFEGEDGRLLSNPKGTGTDSA